MDYKINCFTLHTETPTKGIRLTRNNRGKWGVTVGNNKGAFVRLGDVNGENRPQVRDRKIMRAMGYTAEAGFKKFVAAPNGWQGMIIRILAQNLDFDIDPFVSGLSLNPGGEGAPVFIQQGGHRDPLKDQLFCLEHGQRILVVDRKSAVMTIACEDGTPIVRPAERKELIQHITAYGLQTNMETAVRWAYHTLNELGLKGHPKLKERIARFELR